MAAAKPGQRYRHGWVPVTATPKKPKANSSAIDLSTPEARRRAVASANLSTPAGRALVARAQRASLNSTQISVHLTGRKPPARRKTGKKR